MRTQTRILALFLAVVPLIGQAGPYSAIVVFGDSLSDVGNVNAVTFGLTPGSQYWQGRFSNGPVWIETVASHYAVPMTRSRAGGTNYAYGGAESGTGNTSFIIPNMRTQVSQYLGAKTPNASTLYVIWAGGNDYLDGQTAATTPVNNIATAITSLYNKGARQFLVPNLPRLGEIPRYVGTANETTMNNRSVAHNQALAVKIPQLQASLPGSRIIPLAVQNFFDSVLEAPAQYGFTNINLQAISGVSQPDKYLFWDDVHPTRVGHRLLAERVYTLTATQPLPALATAQ